MQVSDKTLGFSVVPNVGRYKVAVRIEPGLRTLHITLPVVVTLGWCPAKFRILHQYSPADLKRGKIVDRIDREDT